MFAFGMSETVQAAFITTVGGILVAVITRFSRQNAKDHAVVQSKLDKLSDSIMSTHSDVAEIKVEVRHLRDDQNRLETRLDRHMEERA